jgi:hypothetical protein
MLAVVRPGGRVVLNHRHNEAVDEDYVQLHQWNFDERAGDFVIWRPDQETNISKRLGDKADLTCRLRDGWIACQIAKR